VLWFPVTVFRVGILVPSSPTYANFETDTKGLFELRDTNIRRGFWGPLCYDTQLPPGCGSLILGCNTYVNGHWSADIPKFHRYLFTKWMTFLMTPRSFDTIMAMDKALSTCRCASGSSLS
jgi:hypothetical protein